MTERRSNPTESQIIGGEETKEGRGSFSGFSVFGISYSLTGLATVKQPLALQCLIRVLSVPFQFSIIDLDDTQF